jgi:hypothetical protein
MNLILGEHRLNPKAVKRLPGIHREDAIVCTCGMLWVTQEGDLIDLANEFARRRSASLKLLQDLTEADLQLTAHHSELGQVTHDQMIHEWAAHDLNHTVQAERALMQPFLAGCGPWIEYFIDHIFKLPQQSGRGAICCEVVGLYLLC